MVKKKITLEVLAAMVKQGLDELREEIGFTRKELKNDIAKMDERMKHEFVEVQKRFGFHRGELDTVTHRVKRLEKFTGIDK